MSDFPKTGDEARGKTRKPKREAQAVAAGTAVLAVGDVLGNYAALPKAADSMPDDHRHHGKKRKRKARIEHNIPGRIRMRIPSAKGDPALLEAYVSAFSALPGIEKVKAKSETGSITLHYDPKIEESFSSHLHHSCRHNDLQVHDGPPEDEINRLAAKIAREADYLAEHSPLARGTVDFFKGFDRELKIVSNNTIDLKIFLAGGLAAFTFLEIGAAAATPMWVTLALFGVNHFVEMQSTPSSADLARREQ